ncbi:MAG TPA: hypothetical protein VK760_13575 [Candidatus Acidoferrales bacterium]|jgi:hypothetical protein|nr:hypothetical protein [Candidatus Acidoferrales bacterium]
MLDFVDTIFTAAAGAVLLIVICTIPQSRAWRLASAAILGAWTGLAIAIAASGGLANSAVVGILAAVPLVTVAVLAASSAPVRSALLAVPLPLIIGVNVFRVLGAGFLVLASVGRLGGPFPLSAGWGDIITGLLAIPVALLATRVPASDLRIVAWNTFGALDLVCAIALGITSANGSPLQLIHAGAGSAAMGALPWSLVPTVLVPLYLIGHGIVFARVRAASATYRVAPHATAWER